MLVLYILTISYLQGTGGGRTANCSGMKPESAAEDRSLQFNAFKKLNQDMKSNYLSELFVVKLNFCLKCEFGSLSSKLLDLSSSPPATGFCPLRRRTESCASSTRDILNQEYKCFNILLFLTFLGRSYCLHWSC